MMKVKVNLMSSMTDNMIPIGDLARRSGIAASALRFYEDQGLLRSYRNEAQKDWVRLSSAWRPVLDQRIADLTRLRDQLSSCIGCGCLSLTQCALYNPGDVAARRGAGARYLLGDRPPKV